MDRSRQKELQEYYRTLHYLKTNRLAGGKRKSLQSTTKYQLGFEQMEERQNIIEKFRQNALQLLDYYHTLQ
jgi:hypothetical protein